MVSPSTSLRTGVSNQSGPPLDKDERMIPRQDNNMTELLQDSLLLLYLLATSSSSVNTAYFATFQTPRRGRRVGALVLALVSLGTALHSGYSGLAMAFSLQGLLSQSLNTLVPSLLVQGVVVLGSLAVTGLIVRRVLAEGHIR